MSREFKNIDELFRSELGGTVSKVPAGVKANIDKQLGFKSRRYLWLGIPLTVALIAALVMIPDWSENSLADDGTNDNSNNQLVTGPKQDSNESESSIVSNSSNKDTYSNSEGRSADETNETTEQHVDSDSEISSNITSSVANTSTSNTSGRSNIQTNSTSTAPSRNSQDDQATNNQRNVTSTSVTGVATNDSNNSGSDDSQEENTSYSKKVDDSNRQDDISENVGSGNDSDDRGADSENSGSVKDEEDDSGLDNKEIHESEKASTPNDKEIVSDEGNEAERANDVEKKSYDSDEKEVANEQNEVPEGAKENIGKSEENKQEDVSEKADETNKDDKVDNDVTENVEDGVEIEKPKESRKPWMITLEGGPNITKTFYDANNMTEQDLYSSSMSDRVGTELSFMANYRLRKGFAFGTGLQYSSFKEDYDFVDEYWVDDSTVTYEYIYDDSSGLVIDSLESWTYDSTFVSNFNEQGVNKASYLSIPFNLGVQIPWGKFRFDLLASVRYNLLLNASGLHYDDNSFIAFTNKSNNVYKRGYFDAVFAGNIHYNLFKNFYLTASIRYKPVFGNTYNTTGINRRFHYTHLGLGFSLEL